MADQASPPEHQTWIVPADQTEIRLDAFVRRCLPHLSRREVEKAIRSGAFWVNGRPGKKGEELFTGDLVALKGPKSWLSPRPLPESRAAVPIVYEDPFLLVVDKPAGMATHGFSARSTGTLANFLTAMRPDLCNVGKSRWEPGLVHRLDRETSGLMMVAKRPDVFANLRRQFRRGEVRKKYWALVRGAAEKEGVVSYPLAHDPQDRRKMKALLTSSRRATSKNWRAITSYRNLATSQDFSLLEVEMTTGVTHQIRVHLSALGHPIAGDALYGGGRADNLGLQRHFLHAFFLGFRHPEDARNMTLETVLPGDLRDALRRLKIDR